jgi:ClpP class serine protease
MHKSPLLASRILNTPLALDPAKAETILAALGDRLGLAPDARGGQALAFDVFGDSDGLRPLAGYDLVGGVAVVPIDGVLVHKSGFVRPVSGLTGYDGIRAAFLAALEDPAARAIVLDVNSPGGEVTGLFDLVDTIYSARGVKPIAAIAADYAYSAAYAIASAADRVTVPRTGGVGSVGVITILVDQSRAISAAGLKVHFVHYGERKAEETRQSATGIRPDLLERVQADVDAMGLLFCETVARNRGLSRTVVRNLDADYFLGDAGVRARLADNVMAPDDAFRSVLAGLDAA